ncbi:hypothetical protein ACFUIT_03510 [Streptomyces sp. NPDC057239]|uniref:hypothetical protein n=1 Tax=Streptomyces sp. NPDC057239 TaxID=3346061 RepID=UPI003639D654
MTKRIRAGLLAAGAGAFMIMGISPASAATFTAACNTTGANGSLYSTGWDYGEKKIPYISLAVGDSAADGHHVAIRLVTYGYAPDDVTYWQWHHYYGGKGGADSWETSATSERSIAGFKIQAAVFEGSKRLNYCEDSAT